MQSTKKEIKEIFTEYLFETIQTGESFLLEELNDDIISIIAEDESFRQELVKVLLDNQEKLTFKEFSLNDKSTRPTIQNWLKDFIKNQGGDMFDNIKLSQYLSASANIKNLDKNEKELVRKLLILYRNLKFFPNSMPNDTGEGWEIIPISQKVEKLAPSRIASAGSQSHKIENQKPVNEFKITPLQELEILAKQYPAESLERRAIEEEIRKLKS